MRRHYCDICGKEFVKTPEKLIIRSNDGKDTAHFKFSYFLSHDGTYYDICKQCLKQVLLNAIENW
jgi:hypothetical protein